MDGLAIYRVLSGEKQAIKKKKQEKSEKESAKEKSFLMWCQMNSDAVCKDEKQL